METAMLIGGAFEAGTETAERIVNPRNEDLILDLPEANADQIDAAVNAAEKAFAPLVAHHAGGTLRPAAEARRPDRKRGRNARDARSVELRQAAPSRAARRNSAIADCFRFFAGAVRTLHGPIGGEYLPGHTSMMRRDPVGGRRLDRALELSADDGGLEARARAGRRQHRRDQAFRADAPFLAPYGEADRDLFPEGVVNVIVGRGESVGNTLVNHPKVAMISLTGDVATGRKMLQAASKTLKRTHLELGGKAPVIVV